MLMKPKAEKLLRSVERIKLSDPRFFYIATSVSRINSTKRNEITNFLRRSYVIIVLTILFQQTFKLFFIFCAVHSKLILSFMFSKKEINTSKLYISHATPRNLTAKKDIYYNIEKDLDSTFYYINHTRLVDYFNLNIIKGMHKKEFIAPKVMSPPIFWSYIFSVLHGNFRLLLRCMKNLEIHDREAALFLLKAQVSNKSYANFMLFSNLNSQLTDKVSELNLPFEGHTFEIMILEKLGHKFKSVNLHQISPYTLSSLEVKNRFRHWSNNNRKNWTLVVQNRYSKKLVQEFGCKLPIEVKQISIQKHKCFSKPKLNLYLVAPENNKREVYKLLSPFAKSDFGNHDSFFWIRLHPEFPKTLRYRVLNFLIKRRKNVVIIKEPKDADFCNSKFIISSGSSTVIKGLMHGCTPIYWATNPYDNANPFYLDRSLNNLSFKYPDVESILTKAKCLSGYKLNYLMKNHAS
jgi:hypothetical protein